jgi:trimethylamine--corrinoid protein Co-methyltransferase
MAAEMARFYDLPVWGYAGHSDSKLVDGQAAVDAQFSTLVALLAKTNLNHDVGYLESGLTHSPELMVLTDEIISMNRRFIAGVHLDSENLALDVIHSVGPGGDFMSHDHTFTHFRELWTPKIFDRQQYSNWESSGAKHLNARLQERTVDLMENHTAPALSSSIEAEIETILRED